MAFVNASHRQYDIAMLQGRLSGLQRSILVRRCAKSSIIFKLINSSPTSISLAGIAWDRCFFSGEKQPTGSIFLVLLTLRQLKNLGRVVNSQDILVQATHDSVMEIKDMMEMRFNEATMPHEDDPDVRITFPVFVPGLFHGPDFQLPIYTQADVYLFRTIIEHLRLDSGTATVTALHEAECSQDGRVVLVKSYQGAQSPSKTHAVSESAS